MAFRSKDDEILFLRRELEDYRSKYECTKAELDDFEESSKDLEKEMELQLEQSEKKARDLKRDNERFQTELESLKEKYGAQHTVNITQINELQDELAQLRAYKEELEKYIRELEQNNDDLERAKRETVTSLQDFESKLNQAIERNAFLESELDDKDYLMESVQRLKDETRDLRQELNVTKKKKDEPMETTPSPIVNIVKPEVKVEPSVSAPHGDETRTPARHPSLNRANSTSMNGTNYTLSPTARISALNIVGDLLRKVGALETKLNAVRNTVKDQSPMVKAKNVHLAGPSSFSRRSSSHRNSTNVQQPGIPLKIPV